MRLLISMVMIVLWTIASSGAIAGDRHGEQESIWKGYKGEGYYDYWYNPDRKRARSGSIGIVSGSELKEPMGNYDNETKGYGESWVIIDGKRYVKKW